MYPTIHIKQERVDSVHYRHPWIFSGAILKKDIGVTHGGLVRVCAEDGTFLGVGSFSANSSIAVRMFDWQEVVIDADWLVRRLTHARARRHLLGLGEGTQTTGYRACFGEADGIPGLVVDVYADAAVFQLSTAGLDQLREPIMEAIAHVFSPRSIVERSDMSVRKDDGLDEVVAVKRGDDLGDVEFLEHGRRYLVNVLQGQKTGFFLDQRDVRDTVQQLARGRQCLNLFSYTGACSVAAMLGGAASCHSIDLSVDALRGCESHRVLHGFSQDVFTTHEADIFQWLSERREPSYDLVVLDPPALIKSSKDAAAGKKAYHFLNRAAMRLVRDGGVFVTSSCSQHLEEEDLAFILRRASVQNSVDLRVLTVHRQAADHPTSVYFQEASYLKTFVCEVRVC
jgi:23S rRNA (cytosine1962-C5)-methyltransferase